MENEIRVYALARDLAVDAERVLAVCRQAGLAAKNKLSKLNALQRRSVEEIIGRDGPDGGSPSLVRVPHPPPEGGTASSAEAP